jgi:hypothetical protein
VKIDQHMAAGQYPENNPAVASTVSPSLENIKVRKGSPFLGERKNLSSPKTGSVPRPYLIKLGR